MLFICIFHNRHEHWLVLAGETQMEQTMARFSEFLVAENQTSAESQIQPILMSDKKKKTSFSCSKSMLLLWWKTSQFNIQAFSYIQFIMTH